jgi:hypothetical protein
MHFQRASKNHAKLRFAVCGPAGCGKTYTLLQLATELGGPIALIDTERGSASKYADLFEFDVLELDSFDPLNLIEIIEKAANAGYRVLCIDSLSHFWTGKNGELDKVDNAARSMQNPNSFAAWKTVTPIHNALIDKIVSAPFHVLASMRAKTEWVLERDDQTGKTAPRKVGLAPVMRDGIEYEFDVYGEMDQDNTLRITKSRCPKLTGSRFTKPGEEFANVLKQWLTGAPTPAEKTDSQKTPGSSASVNSNVVNGAGGSKGVAVLTEELAAIWKRMCSPRGIAEEFAQLKAAVEQLAGSTGIAEYSRILREHGARHPKDFKTPQSARLCAKDVYVLLEKLRVNARENTAPLELEPATELLEVGKPLVNGEVR